MEFLRSLGRRRAFTALAALLIALGAGHLMQTVLIDRTPVARMGPGDDAAPSVRSGSGTRQFPTPPAATLVPLPAPPVMPDRVDKPEIESPELWEDARMSPFGFSCDPEFSLKRRDAAMIEMRLFAPCDGNQVVTVRHDTLEFAVMTDAFGRASAMMPALDAEAVVTATMPRRDVRGIVHVPEVRAFSRVILSWEGAQVFGMNAYEFGADRGEGGHVWSGSPKTPNRAMRGTGGFLIGLGDGSGLRAEVYTFPTGHSPLRGVVELIVEAEVTEDTCGRLAEAVAFQSNPLGGMSATDVRVTLPGCEQVGDVLELKNLLADMRLAGR